MVEKTLCGGAAAAPHQSASADSFSQREKPWLPVKFIPKITHFGRIISAPTFGICVTFAHKTCQILPSLLCKREFCKENCAKVLTSKLGCAILRMSRKLGEMFGQ